MNFFTYQEKGVSHDQASSRLGIIRGYDNGDWNQELMEQILALHERLQRKSQSGGYVGMDFIDLRIAIFAGRTTVHVARQDAKIARKWDEKAKARFGLDLMSIRTLESKTKVLIRSLERQTKRANRLFLREHTQSEFRSKAHEWQRFLRWIRYHLAYFTKEQTNSDLSVRKYCQTVIESPTSSSPHARLAAQLLSP